MTTQHNIALGCKLTQGVFLDKHGTIGTYLHQHGVLTVCIVRRRGECCVVLLSWSIVQTLKKTFLCKFPWWPDRGGRGVAAYCTVQYSAVLYTGVQMINMAGAGTGHDTGHTTTCGQPSTS